MVVDKEKNVQVSICFSLSGILSLRQKVYSTASQKISHIIYAFMLLATIFDPILSSYVDFTFVDLISLSHVLVLCSTNTSCGRQYHLRSEQTFADSFSHSIPILASLCTPFQSDAHVPRSLAP